MKKFVFEIKEVSYGVEEIWAESEEQARELIESGEGIKYISSSETIIMGLVK